MRVDSTLRLPDHGLLIWKEPGVRITRCRHPAAVGSCTGALKPARSPYQGRQVAYFAVPAAQVHPTTQRAVTRPSGPRGFFNGLNCPAGRYKAPCKAVESFRRVDVELHGRPQRVSAAILGNFHVTLLHGYITNSPSTLPLLTLLPPATHLDSPCSRHLLCCACLLLVHSPVPPYSSKCSSSRPSSPLWRCSSSVRWPR